MSTLIDSAAAEFLLKTAAPRTQPHLLMRARLASDDPYVRDYPVVVIQAPAGYGKTSLLAQWRREQLARGVAVVWFSSDERDDAQRFLLGLVQAVRSGYARPSFGRLLMDGGMASPGVLEGVTAWLAEVSQLPGDVLLIVDEAERLPDAGREALAYILHNAPPNLRVVVAARLGLDVAVDDLLAYGQGVLVGPDRLGFRLDETIALIGKRFGARIDADASARLFQLTDGWPLGLQLAIAAMARAADPLQVVEAMASNKGALRDHLVSALLAKLSDDDKAFLTRVSIVDRLHPDLCRALTEDTNAPARLADLIRETPVFVTSEDNAWCRLHTLVREVLAVRAGQFTDEALTQLHGRAAEWLTQQGMIEEAARHAHAAGQLEIAYDLAERCLHDAVKQGRHQAVLDWLDLLPEAELERRPRLRLAAAWALALGERHQEAERQVERIEAGCETERELRYECALIRSAAAYYADEVDSFLEIFEPWADEAPESASWLAQAHANRLAARAMLLGEPAQARRHLRNVPRGEVGKGAGFLVRWGDHITALSYLWEGQLHLAGEVLLPALASAEADLGQRHPLTCMFAAMAAMQAYEANRIDSAGALLANRLDVLERGGTPETVTIAYRAAARIAAAQGRDHRAVDLLEALFAMGVARRQPRLCAVSLAEQIRLHAGRHRGQTCDGLMQRIDALIGQESTRHGPIWQRSMTLLAALSRAGTAIASRDWRRALEALVEAGAVADAMRLGHYRVEIMALRALALEQTTGDGRPLLLEAMNLAQASGSARTLIDAHPALAEWIGRVDGERSESGRSGYAVPAQPVAPAPAPPHRATGGPRAVPSVVLTPKEREILELLARKFSNKEIAVAAAIGEGTVKWHLKNLFGKLDASSRRHVVHRALVLGLLESA
ncbi:MAG: LuxR family transcriptional regulator [Paraburkholderia sp.]|uniref:helix-turn-helix transcriptional regulator n=1 Tax=Paraburkholderia sp. TaxID=1926495 RepID=UPI0011FF197B|nr:LuxR C-terminal-related transcriptional regulator [Paraburkholderia sp.]TAM01788.1 MAG: LuxR family transcriptional regulator [Paraburkholderia sp.]TAM31559.1 MAG: LuxR family transcriptional regulator [Paraburkholderia sp.]